MVNLSPQDWPHVTMLTGPWQHDPFLLHSAFHLSLLTPRKAAVPQALGFDLG